VQDAEAERLIQSRVDVTRQHIVLAKAYILKNFQDSPSSMLQGFVRDFHAQKPDKVVLHPSVDLEPQVAQAANAIAWRLAFAEAIWSLIGAGVLIPAHSNLDAIDVNQEYTTIVPGSSGTSGGWRFAQYEIAVPTRLRIAPSLMNRLPQPLTDPDLYLSDFEIPGLQAEVKQALRQAALCFRYELNIPCLAMLAKASEGAWIETGLSLLTVDPNNAALTPARRQKTREMLNSQYSSIIQKMDGILELYDKQDLFGQVAKRSGFNQRHLREVLNWSNVVRDSRNAVHYGADPATQNTYEKVAALLLGAVPNIRILYAIRQAAEEIAKTP